MQVEATIQTPCSIHRQPRQAPTTTPVVQLRTYQRRHKSCKVAAAATPPVTPVRLDFGGPDAVASQQIDRELGLAAQGPAPELEAQLATWTACGRASRSTPRTRPNRSTTKSTPPASTAPCTPHTTTEVRTPATAAAIAATSAFLAGITLAPRSPLLGAVPAGGLITEVPPLTNLRRSDRLAKQPLNLTVRPSKKGEVLTMKKQGFIKPGRTDIDGARKEFDNFFTNTVNIQGFPALRDLFPAARHLTDAELMEAVQGARGLTAGA